MMTETLQEQKWSEKKWSGKRIRTNIKNNKEGGRNSRVEVAAHRLNRKLD
jgi:hypothetical protein